MTRLPIRVGIAGCGEIAQLMHLPLLAELEQFKIGGLCDLSASTVDHLGERYRVDFRTTDVSELVESDLVDAVIVATYDHAPVAAAALAHRKHVLVEKPLAFTAAEARTLTSAAAGAGVVSLVGYMKLYDAAVERAGRAAAAMEGLRAITVHDFAGRFDRHGALYTQYRGRDVPKAVLDGGRRDVAARICGVLGGDHAAYAELYTILLMLGSHDLAVVRAVCGEAEGVAYARARGDEQLLAVLDFPDDVPCTLEIGVGTKYEWWDESLTIYGLHEQLQIEFPNPYVRYAPTVLRIREADGTSPSERTTPVSHDSAFRRELLHFADCIRGDARPRTPFSDGLRDLELAEEIIRAMPARTGAR